MIECAFTGRAGKPPETRVTAKGAPWKSVSVAVDGGEAPPEWISVAAFGDVAAELPDDMAPGERVYVEGKLRLSRWQAKDGSERSTLQVNATRVLVLDRIGRRRRRGQRSAPSAGADHQAPLADEEAIKMV